MIEAALANEAGMEPVPAFWNGEEKILRLASEGSGVAAAASPEGQAGAAPVVLPDWLGRATRFEANAMPPVKPSSAFEDLSGPLNGPGLAQARREGLRRGRLMHLLLQYLPGVAAPHRRGVALAFLSARAAGLDETTCLNLTEAALNVIDLPELAGLFGPASSAEVSVAGRVAVGQQMIDVAGQIDRIGEDANEILVADYKTGRPCGLDETPAAYVTQMALYRAVLAQLWPNKTLRMLLIWTEGPFVVPFPAERLDAALAALATG
jgi:ATP-dependent helicase/nuclease subunit A